MRLILMFAVMGLLLFACKKDVVKAIETPQGFVENDWEAAKTRANQENKPIFIHFYKPNCDKCAAFKEDVLNDAEVEKFVSENYIGVFLNTKEDTGGKLAEDFELAGHPAMAITNKDGGLTKKRLGIINKADFLKWME